MSLERRLNDPDGGIIVAPGAVCSWALDGGAMHLYDLAGEPAAAPALLACANGVARAQFAAVLVAVRYAAIR